MGKIKRFFFSLGPVREQVPRDETMQHVITYNHFVMNLFMIQLKQLKICN